MGFEKKKNKDGISWEQEHKKAVPGQCKRMIYTCEEARNEDKDICSWRNTGNELLSSERERGEEKKSTQDLENRDF